MRLKWLAAALVAQSALFPASARQAAPPVEITAPAPTTATSIAETLGVDTDYTARMTVPVSIGGSGPYGFIVDTGSERTVMRAV
jgi:NAD dependent epimerase/dehydratase family enzyme